MKLVLLSLSVAVACALFACNPTDSDNEEFSIYGTWDRAVDWTSTGDKGYFRLILTQEGDTAFLRVQDTTKTYTETNWDGYFVFSKMDTTSYSRYEIWYGYFKVSGDVIKFQATHKRDAQDRTAFEFENYDVCSWSHDGNDRIELTENGPDFIFHFPGGSFYFDRM